MDHVRPVLRSRRRRERGPWLHSSGAPGALILALALSMPTLLVGPARAGGGMGAIVRAFCLSAFENEMSLAGKTPPEGMANFACDCIEERLRSGTNLDSAKRNCRQATARRYPI